MALGRVICCLQCSFFCDTLVGRHLTTQLEVGETKRIVTVHYRQTRIKTTYVCDSRILSKACFQCFWIYWLERLVQTKLNTVHN